jgi:hypothetical protein
LLKALESAVLARFFFMTRKVTNMAIKTRPTRPPTTPPAMVPALEPPPFLGVYVGKPVLVPVPVDTEGCTPVDSGRSAKTRWLAKGNL